MELRIVTDTGSILTTGGWDFVNNNYFNEDGNESIQTNRVGGDVGVRGGTLPEPITLTIFGVGLAVCCRFAPTEEQIILAKSFWIKEKTTAITPPSSFLGGPQFSTTNMAASRREAEVELHATAGIVMIPA